MTDTLERWVAAPAGSLQQDPGRTTRGDRTRDRLLDAAESMVAESGFDAPSHRTLAARAGVHVALIHYHFGGKDALYDAALARRADALADALRAALDLAGATGPPGIGAILRAWWRPCGAALGGKGGIGRDYLCMVARLGERPAGDASRTRLFGAVEERYLRALGSGIAGARPRDVAAGWCYATRLMNDVLLGRCGHRGGSCAGKGDGDDALERLFAWLEAGMRSSARVARATPVGD